MQLAIKYQIEELPPLLSEWGGLPGKALWVAFNLGGRKILEAPPLLVDGFKLVQAA